MAFPGHRFSARAAAGCRRREPPRRSAPSAPGSHRRTSGSHQRGHRWFRGALPDFAAAFTQRVAGRRMTQEGGLGSLLPCLGATVPPPAAAAMGSAASSLSLLQAVGRRMPQKGGLDPLLPRLGARVRASFPCHLGFRDSGIRCGKLKNQELGLGVHWADEQWENGARSRVFYLALDLESFTCTPFAVRCYPRTLTCHRINFFYLYIIP